MIANSLAQTATDKRITPTRATAGTKTVLKMIFACENSKSMTWNLEGPKDNLTFSEVSTFMDACVDDEVVLYGNNKALDIKDAYIYTTTTTELQ